MIGQLTRHINVDRRPTTHTQVLVKPGKGQWGSTTCPPVGNITTCTERISVPVRNGGGSAIDYYGCSFTNVEGPQAGQFPCGGIYNSGVGFATAIECLDCTLNQGPGEGGHIIITLAPG